MAPELPSAHLKEDDDDADEEIAASQSAGQELSDIAVAGAQSNEAAATPDNTQSYKQEKESVEGIADVESVEISIPVKLI